ncbi:MAG: hypothetical protein AABY22_28380 [Nanoarchaeota archaeon]
MPILNLNYKTIFKSNKYRKISLCKCDFCKIEKEIDFYYAKKLINNKLYRCSKCSHTEQALKIAQIPWTNERRKKLSLINKNKLVSENSRKKMSNSQKLRWNDTARKERSLKYSGENNPNYNPNRQEVKINKKTREICKTMLGNFLNGKCKNGKTKKILGYTSQEFRKNIESKWETWMNWDNYGHHSTEKIKKWNIDHIVPISKFTKYGITNPKIVNALNNLRPLESRLNFRKHTKSAEDFDLKTNQTI